MKHSHLKYRVDISAIAGRGAAALHAGGMQAVTAARTKFDMLSSQRFTRSGREIFPMGASVRVTKRAVTYRLRVTNKKLPMWKFQITPNPSAGNTTGSARQRITFAFRQGQSIALAKGFNFGGITYRRIGGGYVVRKNGSHGSGHITTADKLMFETFSPSLALGDLAPEVLAELIVQVEKGITEALK